MSIERLRRQDDLVRDLERTYWQLDDDARVQVALALPAPFLAALEALLVHAQSDPGC